MSERGCPQCLHAQPQPNITRNTGTSRVNRFEKAGLSAFCMQYGHLSGRMRAWPERRNDQRDGTWGARRNGGRWTKTSTHPREHTANSRHATAAPHGKEESVGHHPVSGDKPANADNGHNAPRGCGISDGSSPHLMRYTASLREARPSFPACFQVTHPEILVFRFIAFMSAPCLHHARAGIPARCGEAQSVQDGRDTPNLISSRACRTIGSIGKRKRKDK